MLRWVGRAGLAFALALMGKLAMAAPSLAAGRLPLDDKVPPPYRSPALAWIDLHDQKGISVWNYGLSIEHGGLTNPSAFIWAPMVDYPYMAYENTCAAGIWFVDWVMSFEWVTFLAEPISVIGTHLHDLVAGVGVVPALLTVSALIGGVWLLRGRSVGGIWEILTSCVIAALAVGVFAAPYQLIAGPDGLMMQTREAGLGFVAAATGDADGGRGDAARQQLTSQLITTFVRQPTQLINFGAVLDGGPCEKVYDEVVKAGPYAQDDGTIRDKVGECAEPAGKYASSPGAGMVAGAWTVAPAGGWMMILSCVMGVAVLIAGVRGMYLSVKMVITNVLGVAPGAARGSFFMTLSGLVISLGILLFTLFFFGVYLSLIGSLFATAKGDDAPKTFIIVDIVMIAAVGIYLRERKRLEASTERLASWLGQRPGAGPTALPQRMSSGMASAAAGIGQTAMRLGTMQAMRRAGRGGNSTTNNMLFVGGSRGGEDAPDAPDHLPHQDLRRQPVGLRALPGPGPGAGPDALPGSPVPPPALGPSGAGPAMAALESRRAATQVIAGTVVKVAGQAALAHATGGASTAVLRVGRAISAANSVRREAVQAQLTPVPYLHAASSRPHAPQHDEAARQPARDANVRRAQSDTAPSSAPRSAGGVGSTSGRGGGAPGRNQSTVSNRPTSSKASRSATPAGPALVRGTSPRPAPPAAAKRTRGPATASSPSSASSARTPSVPPAQPARRKQAPAATPSQDGAARQAQAARRLERLNASERAAGRRSSA